MKFDFTKSALGGCLLLVAAIILALRLSPSGPTEASPDRTTQLMARAEGRLRPTPKPHSAHSPENRPAEAPDLADEAVGAARDAAIEKMQEASTSYDPAELPVIRPYLASPDPELRAAAVDAMIVLGDASAGSMLREAAKNLDSAEEVKKMEQAADYIELPPANLKKISEMLKKRRESKKAAMEQEANKSAADEVK